MRSAPRSTRSEPSFRRASHRRGGGLVVAGVLALLLASAPSAWALDPSKSLLQFPRRVWQTPDGLPQNAIQALAQTPDGYLWGGTWEGLVRFDGVRFTTFDRINTPELQGRSIQCLATAPDGTLWIGTEVGLTGMREGRFFPVVAPPDIPLRNIHTLRATRDGSLWIATTGQGLLRFFQGRFQVWNSDNGLSSDRVQAFVEDARGTLWVGTTAGLHRWDGTALHPAPLFDGPQPPVHSLVVDKDDTLWAGTEQGIVYRLEAGRMRPVPEASLPGAPIEAMLADRPGTLWVGSTGRGLLRLAYGQRSTLDASQGLLSNTVASLLEDSEGNIWIGAAEGGLHRLKDALFTSLGPPEGLPQRVVSSIHEAPDGSLWFASLGNGVTRWFGGKMTTYTTREGLIHDRVRSMAPAREGGVWFSAQTGVSLWRAGAFTLSIGTEQGMPPGPIRAVYEDAEGILWAGTPEGLARWNGERLEVLTRKDGLPGDNITLLHPRPAGGFWVGTAGGGLAYFVHGRPTTVAFEGQPMFSELQALHEESNGTLWLGTDEGLYRWKAGHFSRFSRAEGLFDDRIFQILPDGRGYLWMSCNKGIFRVAHGELEAVAEGTLARVTSHTYGQDDGMRAEECNGVGAPAGIRARDGRLWFPTIRGAVVHDPRQPEAAVPSPPPVLIEELRVDGQPVASTEWGRIPPGEGHVEIHYTSPSLRAPQRLDFRYQLEGIDKEWLQAGTRRVAYYTRLPPGDYRFRVLVASTDGSTSAPETMVAFRLEPRLYQTLGFRVVAALALVLGLVGAVWLRVQRLRVRERRLQKRVAQRTAELATVNADLQARLQELQATRERLVHAEKMAAVGTLAAGVGHEINNPLAFIISNLHYATTEVRKEGERGGVRTPWQDVAKALEEALEGADRVRRIVQDLKTFSRVQPEQPQRVELHTVLDLALAISEAETRHRARVVRDYGAPPAVFGDETRLGQVFLNLLVNAAQAIPEGHADTNEIRVTTRADARGQAVVVVSDTGSGISPEVLPRIFEPFFTTKPVGVGTGLGLSICHSYVEAMGGAVHVRSELGRGTTFEVVLPAAVEEAVAPPVPSGVPVSAAVPRGRLLIIDDEPLLTAALARTLAPEHEVETFTRAGLALERLRGGERYALILCDLMMPEMTGMELHETLARELPSQAERMVFLTGGAFTETARTFLERSRMPCLEKPFEPDHLRARVRELLSGRPPSASVPAA
ncbi:two-component regulator propeller domain-containing protein [Hyalangium rubrum]|uniref:histidine kinase n=1 Tax=Hyalangium rubrum TaxID=3103134 RepID=A0ABU5HFZ5_9BACT|nr:two-component regulator propeller domain-containing protein [Hyalangium sp. s54d21]MDY7232185.1 two-component regulator propeller domain-containing protein [Hyalangium sp. s54d21]